MTVPCSDHCASLHNSYGIILSNTSKSSIDIDISIDILFACSEMLPLCGINDAFPLLSPTSYVTSFVTFLGRHLWSFKKYLLSVIKSTCEQWKEHRVRNQKIWFSSQLFSS